MSVSIIILFLLLLIVGFDVGFTMIIAAYAAIITGDRLVNETILPQHIVASADHFVLLAIPLFILAGEIMNFGGLTQRLVDWALALLGHVRGALGQVALLTNLLMAGVSGSGAADAAATGRILIPAMRKEGYNEGYAGALIAAGAMLGPILPPSVPMIIYAVMANVSVMKLFMAGVVPGFLLFMGYSVICRFYPTGQKVEYFRKPLSNRERIRATLRTLPVLTLPIVVLGGMRFGLVTDTEAAALASVWALVVAMFFLRELSPSGFGKALASAARSSAAILFLLAAAGPLAWLIAESRVNLEIAAAISSISSNPLIVLLTINILLLVVGFFLEPLPAMIVFIPTLIPIGASLGLDPIHFGMIVILNLMIGMLTPPVGLLLFVASGAGKVPVAAIIRHIWPFVLWSLVVLTLVTLFPGLTLWLSSTP
ncbi:TRAP transporter large permease [Tianweitania sediminis]|uniref:TRAP transporter large permease protein n=1 Tax=Tianweitania sediminis TaxID=1502156 RepID=A0A8J7UKS3_9HYPH|nr:TRAP transporter large permease [Tianweitania sediminis]MBP0439979.1 TRAP transporter large permease [Tianweitania sediminis]